METSSAEVLSVFKDAYLQWKSFQEIKYQVEHFLKSAKDDEVVNFQSEIHSFLNEESNKKYPVEPEHKERFLKKLGKRSIWGGKTFGRRKKEKYFLGQASMKLKLVSTVDRSIDR